MRHHKAIYVIRHQWWAVRPVATWEWHQVATERKRLESPRSPGKAHQTKWRLSPPRT